ncbi:hypothetical protein F4802DRAFT_595183 [Xylaria palmicola]|nr:hypothetical protein F4802DRAFT_595183 [Xylaria palmicola]
MTPLSERPFYIGIMALPVTVGRIPGPTIGALFIDFVSWRLKTVDWTGMSLFRIGCAAFVVPLSWGGALYPWNSWKTLLLLFVGVVVLAIFAFYESRPASPILPHCLFLPRAASMTLIGGFFHGTVLFLLLQHLPIFYQPIKLQTRIESVVTLPPTSIISVLTAFLSAIAAILQKIDDTGLAVSLLIFFRTLSGLVGLAVGSTIFSSVFTPYIADLNALPDSIGLPTELN